MDESGTTRCGRFAAPFRKAVVAVTLVALVLGLTPFSASALGTKSLTKTFTGTTCSATGVSSLGGASTTETTSTVCTVRVNMKVRWNDDIVEYFGWSSSYNAYAAQSGASNMDVLGAAHELKKSPTAAVWYTL